MWKNIILEPFVVIAKNTRLTKNSRELSRDERLNLVRY